tara:strand:+ start:188 stop:754 length:567 start_codon:yes stop_codon:yes gene_type:complete
MVRNLKGGKNGKKGARKHIVSNSFNQKLRVAEEDGEVYGCVTKLLGNGMCNVNCLEDDNTAKARLCIIRNKFRGRGKRGNEVTVGTYVLLGLREWESSKEGTKPKCDLIEVYGKYEIERLKIQVNVKWSLIHVANITESTNTNEELDDIFAFTNENTELKKELEIQNTKEVADEDCFGGDSVLDIDDI